MKKIESVTSHNLYPPPPVTNCHTFSDPLPPLERDILYGRPPTCMLGAVHKNYMVHKNYVLTNQQPTYLYNSLSFPSHSVSTRSSDSLVLSIPYVRSSLGKRAFSVIGPRLWNSLPPDTRNSSSLPIFRSRLKTHLFKIAFPP